MTLGRVLYRPGQQSDKAPQSRTTFVTAAKGKYYQLYTGNFAA